MAKRVQIASGLALDPDYFGAGTFALLAKKGAGKSYASRVLAEEMWSTGVPFALFDPMGVCWGLRSSADGKGDGIPVAIFGGKHGDAPLERGAGKLMADLAIDEGLSMILDFSEFGSHAAEREFAQAFLDRLYFRNDRLYHLLIDEADLFAPQKPQKGAEQLLGVMDNVVRRGRNRGIGVTLMTQRPAVLNKDVLTQIDGLVAMRVIGLPDRQAVDHWVMGHGEDQDAARQVKGSLAGLANGESWWWVPELKILKRVQIRESRTFDSSPSRTRSTKAVQPKGFADVDMAAIQQRMATTLERAKAEDPRELHKRIRTLERQLAEMEKQEPITIAEVQRVEVPVEVPVLPDGHADALTEIHQAVDRAAHDLLEARARLGHLAEDAGKVPTATAQGLASENRRLAVVPTAVRAPESPPRPARPSPMQGERGSPPSANGEVNAPRQRILDTIAWFAAIGVTAPKRGAVAPLAGTTASSSGFEKNLSGLRTLGLIDYPAGGRLALTPAGQDIARQPDGVPTTEALQQAVLSKLNAPRAAILRALIEVYPDALTREDLADRVGTSSSSSGFDKNLSGLRTLELIDYPARGTAAALPVLFVESN